MQSEEINHILLKQMIASGTANLNSHKSEVDALNVFPVPDGDTGTNMFLTFQSAVREMNKNQSLQISELLESVAYGALMGARGNSGVIVSQFFRGFVKALPKDIHSLTKTELVLGLSGASNLCYQAVRKPVEGTILTIIREMAKYAAENASESISLVDLLTGVLQHANHILGKTPEMLPVLKQAGVVDAGGQGLVHFVKGALLGLTGTGSEIKLLDPLPESKQVLSISSFTDNELLADVEINYQYCTEFILKGKQLDLEHLKNSLNPHGDCLLVVGDSNTAKIHIHTNNPGIILDFAVRMGEMSEIQINNMVEQHQQRLAKKMLEAGASKQINVVAVVTGDGIERIFRSLGVGVIVNGGQTMNPSIEDLTKAISLAPAPEVIILPNNRNIIMTANHVPELVNKRVQVVPTHNLPEGLAAMLAFSENLSLDENAAQMIERSNAVISGEITYATRDILLNSLNIKQGDIIGLVDEQVVAFGKNPEAILESTLQKVPQASSGLVTIYYGMDVTPTNAQNLLNKLENSFPDAEFELYYGGQPLYYYLFSVE
ncbi:MAG TPA: DAK2 domain-containing protein [Bacillota bacterium]|nr:DAK2 domain-containing protein [Bacillota bacterium]